MDRKSILKLTPDPLYIYLEKFFKKETILSIEKYNDLRTFIFNEVFKDSINYPFEYYKEYFDKDDVEKKTVSLYNKHISSSLKFNPKDFTDKFTIYNPSDNSILKSSSTRINTINNLKYFLLNSYYVAYKDSLIVSILKKPSIYGLTVYNPKMDLINKAYSILYVDALLNLFSYNNGNMTSQVTFTMLPTETLIDLIDYANLCELHYRYMNKMSIDIYDNIEGKFKNQLNDEESIYETIDEDDWDSDYESGAGISQFIITGGSKKLLLKESELIPGKIYLKKMFNNNTYFIDEEDYKDNESEILKTIDPKILNDMPNPEEVKIRNITTKDGDLNPSLSKQEYFQKENYIRGRDFESLALLLEQFKTDFLNDDFKKKANSVGLSPQQIVSSILDSILSCCKADSCGNNNYLTNIVNTIDPKISDKLVNKIREKM